jgi:phosphocarrier protein
MLEILREAEDRDTSTVNYVWGEKAMYSKEVTVQNHVGLHARPATFFIQKANEFKSSIWVERDDRRVNAKSLLGVLSLGIIGGTDIRILAGGSDEENAVEELVKLVNSGFAEA